LIDAYSSEWREIKAHLEKRLNVHRTNLETPGLSFEETEGARYAIAEIKALLKLPESSMIGSGFMDEANS